MNLVEIGGTSVLIGFGISWVFLAGKLFSDRSHGVLKVLTGSLVGAILIAATCFFCLISVVGISILCGVSLTAFSIMSFVLSVGFAVEYSVHIVARWLRSDRRLAVDRVEQTMSFLMLPTFMSFVSSTVGVICLAFTNFEFNTRFFFRPLITVRIDECVCAHDSAKTYIGTLLTSTCAINLSCPGDVRYLLLWLLLVTSLLDLVRV